MLAAGPAAVVLFGRPGCTLCLEAEYELRALAPRFGFNLQVVDIESDDALLQRYLFEIPVVTLDGEFLARAPIRKETLERLLAAALPARRTSPPR